MSYAKKLLDSKPIEHTIGMKWVLYCTNTSIGSALVSMYFIKPYRLTLKRYMILAHLDSAIRDLVTKLGMKELYSCKSHSEGIQRAPYTNVEP